MMPLASAAAPNIVYILADDMGYGDPAYAGGKIPTPNLDRLAKEGMQFSDAHTSSAVCTPTRYGILTGRYNWRSPMKKGVLNGFSDPLIPESRQTVAAMLKDAGYHTSVIGKWHLGLKWPKLGVPGSGKGPGWDVDYAKRAEKGPIALGFSEDFLYPASLDMPPYVYLRNDVPVGIPTVTKSFQQPKRPGPATADFEAENVLPHLAREAREFIAREAQKKAHSFFLYMPLTSPHTPLVPTGRWQGKSGLGDYADFMMETDWVVGEVLAELDARGVAGETLVIFTSDNGCSPMAKIPELAEKGHKVNGSLRGHKADIFEGGHRVPFLVRWPGRWRLGAIARPRFAPRTFSLQLRKSLAKSCRWTRRKTAFPCCRCCKARTASRGPTRSITRSTVRSRSAKENGSCHCALVQADGRIRNPARRPKACIRCNSMIWKQI